MASISPLSSPSVAIVANGDIQDLKIIKDALQKFPYVIAADGGANHCCAMEITPKVLIGDCDSIFEQNLDFLKKKKVRIISALPDKDETDLQLAVNEALKLGATNIVVYGALGKRLDHTLYNLLLLFTKNFNTITIRTEREIISSKQKEGNSSHKNETFFTFYEPRTVLKSSNEEILHENQTLCVKVLVMNSSSLSETSLASPEAQLTTPKLDSYSVGSIFKLLKYLKKNPSEKVVGPTEEVFMIPEGMNTKYPTTPGQIISFLPLSQLEGLFTTGLKWPLSKETFSTFFMSMSNRAEGNEIEIRLEKGQLLCFWNRL